MYRVIEALESRIAPAAVFTYTEADGDKVTIKTTAKISNADFESFIEISGNAEFSIDGDLNYLNLEDPVFRDTSLTITVKKDGGDGKATIGSITSPFDLKSVTIKGDLGSIQVGDNSPTKPGIGKLTVNSLGIDGNSSYFAGAGTINILGNLESEIYTEGANIGSVKVSGDVENNGYIGGWMIDSVTVGGDLKGRVSAYILDSVRIGGDLVGGDNEDAGTIDAYRINSVRIGGSILGGESYRSGGVYADSLGTVMVRGDVEGGTGEDTGVIWGDEDFGKVIVLGDVIGGSGEDSGQIRGYGPIGLIQIGGDLIGGFGYKSGWVGSDEGGSIDKITIGGSVIGGEDVIGESYSGRIEGNVIGSIRIGKNLEGGAAVESGSISAYGVGTLSIGGSIIGGVGPGSGAIDAGGLGSVTVKKDVAAGGGLGSGSITGYGGIESVKIGGSLEGNVEGSGSIASFQGAIGAITIGKGLSNTGDGITGIYAARDIGKIVIKGDVSGGNYGTLGIRAGFLSNAFFGSVDSIGSVSIKGDVTNFLIEAGIELEGAVNADASIGSVKITGSLTTSSIVAGSGAGDDGFYGTADDELPLDSDGIVSRIASVVIGKTVAGTATDVSGLDGYGIFAQHIVSAKIKGAKQELEADAGNDLNAILLGETEDFRLVELPVPSIMIT